MLTLTYCPQVLYADAVTLSDSYVYLLASGYASQSILSRSSSSEIGWGRLQPAARRAYCVKNTVGCMAGLTLTVICVAAEAS